MEPVSDPRIYSNRYQVTHLIARGGMAMVYRAQDLLLNRAVALKILYPELSADPAFVERFRREAQAAANLSHPNIVPVFDWGEDDGTYFIVMELVDGTSLAEVLRGSRTLTASRSVTIAAQVAAALGYAHRNGVVHRDVKPGNILITSDGQVKVTDFGIAQAVSSEDQLAEEGSVMGTATYFSPEQASGESVDGRSDVYSLGVVLYEMLAGRPPFIGDSPLAVSTQHVHGSVPFPTQFNDTVPRDLEAIVMESLGKSPSQRYQSADEFRTDLIRFNEGEPVRAAGLAGAFFGADATRAVSAVSVGERTQAVPMMQGPRTDFRRRRSSHAGVIATVIILLLALGGLAYFFLAKSHAVTSMPDVVGQPVATAKQTLIADGLVVAGTTQVFSQKPSGTVVSTDPKAKATITQGESVTLKISLGKTVTPVTVPDTKGMPVSDAESKLDTLKLNYKLSWTSTATAGQRPDTVLRQTPKAGTKTQTGTTVTLVLLRPGSAFLMPQLSLDTRDAALVAIGQAGLSVSPTPEKTCSNTVAKGLVVSTNPAAGTPVKVGAPVTLITSSGLCKVYVPNVLTQTESAATAALHSQHLVAATSYAPQGTCAPTSPFGTVFSQSVPGGSSVLYGSTVDLVLCPVPVATTTTTTY
jgi:beta-lactam-binding protein with PASTA domain/tRNA A-37 threonylcarbamoyl transferase component Bud32